MAVIDENRLRDMGYVCSWCGKVKPLLSRCSEGCTTICADCFDSKGWKHTHCK